MRATKTNTTISERNIGTFQKGYTINTIYIGNLSYSKNEGDIKKLFTRFGEVSFVRLNVDTKTRLSKGIAFVQMPNKQEALKAIKGLDGQIHDDRTLKVSIAKESGMTISPDKKKYDPTKPKAKKPEESKSELVMKKKKRPKGLTVLFNHLNSK
jgi:RNA recognition motif-containing protein